MAITLNVLTNAQNLDRAIVRGVADRSPVAFPESSISDIRDLELKFTDGTDFESWSGDAGVTPEVAIGECGSPDSGNWTLEGGGSNLNLTKATLSATATPQQVEDAIVANSSATASDVKVTGAVGFYEIEFIGALADTDIEPLTAANVDLTPRSSVSVTEITEGGSGDNAFQTVNLAIQPLAYQDSWTPNSSGDGWTGTLKLDGTALKAAQKEADSKTITRDLVVRTTDADGKPTVWARRSVTIYCDLIPADAFTGEALPNALNVNTGDNRYDRRTRIDVRNYEDQKNGSDWQPAIQATIDAVETAGGGVAWIPGSPTTYMLGKELVVPANVKLQGRGRIHTKLKFVDTATPTKRTLDAIHSTQMTDLNGSGTGINNYAMIITDPDVADKEGIEISGMSLNFNGDNVRPDIGEATVHYVGLHIYKCKGAQVRDVFVEDVVHDATIGGTQGAIGILDHVSTNTTFDDVEATHCGYEGIGFRNKSVGARCNRIAASDCRLHAIALQPNSDDVIIDGVRIDQDFADGNQCIQIHCCKKSEITNVKSKQKDTANFYRIDTHTIAPGDIPVEVAKLSHVYSRGGRLALFGGFDVYFDDIDHEGSMGITDQGATSDFLRLYVSNTKSKATVATTNGMYITHAGKVVRASNCRFEATGAVSGVAVAEASTLYATNCAAISGANAWNMSNGAQAYLVNCDGDGTTADFRADGATTRLQIAGGESVNGTVTRSNSSTIVIRDLVGYATEDQGTATIASGTTDEIITYSLGRDPDLSGIRVQPTNDMGSATKFWIENGTAGEFTLRVDQDPGAGGATFVWRTNAVRVT